MAERYRLNVNIEECLLPSYNNTTEPYYLCVAKKVGDDFNVVFQCKKPMMENTFTWTEEYQIFVTTDPFEIGAPVVKSDAAKAIHDQQLFILTEFGTRQISDGKGFKPGQFRFRNNFDEEVYAVVLCATAGGVFKPIYRQPTPTPKHGTARFTPKSTYMVWLQQDINDAYMFAEVDSTACVVEYEGGATTQTVTLNNAEVWVGDVVSSDSNLRS